MIGERMNQRGVSSGGAACVAILALAHFAVAGDLNPPAGPIAPTGKTLAEVEPRTPIAAATTPGDAGNMFRITQPGSYYLTANIQAVPNKNGIEIAASDVTLDLMGFAVVGDGSYQRDGVRAATGVANIVVRSGTLRGWDGDGLDLFSAADKIVEAIAATDNQVGILAGPQAILLSCTAGGNVFFGILTSIGSTVSECSVVGSANGAGGNGMLLTGSAVRHCTTTRTNVGMSVGNSAVLACTVLNSSVGLNGASGSAVTTCSARANVNNGFGASSGGLFAECTASGNSEHGFIVFDGCLILNNNAFGNGGGPFDGAGVAAIGTMGGNRIEGNNVVSNEFGIDVDQGGNLIIRNSAKGNTLANFDIVAGNSVGPMVNAGNIATNDKPHANYDY